MLVAIPRIVLFDQQGCLADVFGGYIICHQKQLEKGKVLNESATSDNGS